MANPIRPHIKSIGLWTLKGLVSLLFFAAAAAKLSSQPMLVQEFQSVGLGQGFRIATGLMELAGSFLLLVPKTSRLGGAVLLLVCIGALVAQTLKIHGDLIHVFVLMALTGFLAWSGGDRQASPLGHPGVTAFKG